MSSLLGSLFRGMVKFQSLGVVEDTGAFWDCRFPGYKYGIRKAFALGAVVGVEEPEGCKSWCE